MSYDNTEKSRRDVRNPELKGPEPSDRRRLDVPRGSRSFKGMLIAAAVLIGVLVLLSVFSIGGDPDAGATVDEGGATDTMSSEDTATGGQDNATQADPSE